MPMQDGPEAQTRKELNNEIQTLEKSYNLIRNYLSGKEYDDMEIIGNLRVFKDTLSRISAHILTLYTMKGQRTKITWDSLFVNIDNALATLSAFSKRRPRETIQLAFNMSEPKVEEVMAFLSKLKASLK